MIRILHTAIDTIATTTVTPDRPTLSPEVIAGLEQLGQQIYRITHGLAPYVGLICMAVAWLTLFAMISNAIAGLTAAKRRVQTMHSIPCSRCAFFTNDHRLKCPVDPISAGSEAAIGCMHYEPSGDTYRAPQS